MKKYMKIQNNTILPILLYSFLLSTIFSYLGYYLYSTVNQINVILEYGNYSSVMNGAGSIAAIMRFSKEVIIVLMLIYSCLRIKTKKQIKILLLFSVWVLYGILLSLISGYSCLTIIAGVHSYMFIIVLVFGYNCFESRAISLQIIKNIIFCGAVINCIASIDQAFRLLGTNFELIGSGSYRFPGIFGAVGMSSEFDVIVALFSCILDVIKNNDRKYSIFLFIISFISAIFSGARSAILNILIIGLVWLFLKNHMTQINKAVLIGIFGAVMIPLFIIVITNFADRGNILDVQLKSGRLHILIDILKSGNVYELIFGRGIGVGSNSDVLLQRSATIGSGRILDGTFNLIMYQYGLFGIFIAVYLIIFLLKKLLNNKQFILDFLFVGTIILRCFTGNLLEFYSVLAGLILCYDLLIGSKIAKTN